METPKLHIEPKRFTEESTVASIRIPKDMLREFDGIAKATGRTRNEIITLCLEFALNNMEPSAENHIERG